MQFSSGRRTLVYNRLRVIAVRRGVARLVAYLDRALAHERRTRELENRWSAAGGRLHPEPLRSLDRRVDRVLTSIRDIAADQATGLPDGHPTADVVARFLAATFPHGVRAISGLPYVDQVLAMEALLRELQGRMAGAARELGLEPRVQQLAEMTREYRGLVDAGRDDISFEAVEAANERGQLYLREVIALVVGTFHDSDDADHVAARDELLEPVSEQLALLHARARARRRGGRAADQPGALDAAGEDLDEPDDADGVGGLDPAAEDAAGAGLDPAAEDAARAGVQVR